MPCSLCLSLCSRSRPRSRPRRRSCKPDARVRPDVPRLEPYLKGAAYLGRWAAEPSRPGMTDGQRLSSAALGSWLLCKPPPFAHP